MDQTGPSTDDGVKAIIHALKKVGVHGGENDRFKLRGSTTDSGGAMTLESLADPLMDRQIGERMLIANCTMHCVQLQLSNPMILLMGDGALGKRNVMQMLHSQYALQNSMPPRVFGIEMATDFLNNDLPEVPTKNMLLLEKNRELYMKNKKKYKAITMDQLDDPYHFEHKLELIGTFKEWSTNRIDYTVTNKKVYKSDANWLMVKDDDGNEKQVRQTYIKPILTRWESIGRGAHVTHETYLPTFCTCQVIINTYASKVQGKIAAELMSLMDEPELYSDLTLVSLFHHLN